MPWPTSPVGTNDIVARGFNLWNECPNLTQNPVEMDDIYLPHSVPNDGWLYRHVDKTFSLRLPMNRDKFCGTRLKHLGFGTNKYPSSIWVVPTALPGYS